MIVFDLACASGHVFEAWFGSSGDYDDQRGRGLVSCPVCGGGDIEKAVMAPRVGTKGNRAAQVAKSMLAELAAAQSRLLENSDFVGTRFAEEARAIHLGEADARAIHGQATRAEAKGLIDDGVPVAPLPLPVIAPDERN